VATPDAAEARRSLGHALAEKGRLEEAEFHLEEAVGLSESKDPLALFLLGRVYADLGKTAQAIEKERLALVIALQLNNMELARAVGAHLKVLQRER
jgi:tetratricopeptide (TPR) repeat protein